MSKLNITEARKQLLDLPRILHSGESIDVVRHQKTVLRIIRVADEGEEDPLAILDRAVLNLSKPKKNPPQDLAAHYKKYLYGKKS